MLLFDPRFKTSHGHVGNFLLVTLSLSLFHSPSSTLCSVLFVRPTHQIILLLSENCNTLKLNSFTSNHVLRVTHKLLLENFSHHFIRLLFSFLLRITFFMVRFIFETFLFLCASKIPSFLKGMLNELRNMK